MVVEDSDDHTEKTYASYGQRICCITISNECHQLWSHIYEMSDSLDTHKHRQAN